MKKKRIVIIAVIAFIFLAFLFRTKLIQTYVTVFHKHLETYSETLLASGERTNTNYGFWDVSVYPEENMVEFMTGGFGLAPSSTYQGFYYSGDNTHKVFSAADTSIAPLNINGDHATWTDGTDNHGTSTRITDRWFWFKASF